MAKHNDKIIIAGAGIGGLTAALCLLKAGRDVEIYERAPAAGARTPFGSRSYSAKPAFVPGH